METKINSRRLFKIGGFEGGRGLYDELTMDEILNSDNDSELLYSLREFIDDILDLTPNASLDMYCNRDSRTPANKIIVWRIA